MATESPDEPLSKLDTNVAHSARVYDYWLGGKDNFAADREAGDRVIAIRPQIRSDVRENRAFLRRAVRFLAAEAGIRQFLDIGTGLPSAGNTHEVAQAVVPEARVVYVDNDPLVLAHARALLTGTPGTTAYLSADLREPAEILHDAAAALDFGQPVAVMLVAVLHHIADADDPAGIIATLMAAVAGGQPPGHLAPGGRRADRGGHPGRHAVQPARGHRPDPPHPGAGGRLLRRPRTAGARRGADAAVAPRGDPGRHPGADVGGHGAQVGVAAAPARAS